MRHELLRLLIAGKRVLIRSYTHEYRLLDMETFWKDVHRLHPEAPALKRQTSASIITMPETGGLAHWAVRDEEVMGMEYHVGDGYLTKVMETRVRL